MDSGLCTAAQSSDHYTATCQGHDFRVMLPVREQCMAMSLKQ
jgi:hypothetical protein